MTINMNTIKKGDFADMVTRGVADRVQFVGFTNYVEQYCEEATWQSLREAKAALGVRTNKELEKVGEHLGYGHSVYAIFIGWDNTADKYYEFSAYLFNGRWCVGSSADAVKLQEV